MPELGLAPGLAQVGRQRGVGADHRLHLRIEEADRVAPRALGLVHGQVGLLEQLAHHAVALAEQRHADAAGGVVQVARQHVGLAQRGQDAFGHRARAGRRVQRLFAAVFQQDHELVSAQAGDRVALGHAGAQALGHQLQQQVALLVTQRVVEHLEVVQVDEHQRAFARARRVGQRRVQPVHEQLAVGQLGEGVVEGQVLDLLFGQLALGDVAAHRHPVGELALLVPHGRDVQVHPERLAVLLVVDQVDARGTPLLERRADLVEGTPLRVGTLQQPRRAPDHLVAGVAGAALERLVDEHDARARFAERAGFRDDHDVVQAGDAALQQPQLLLRLAPLGHVAQVDGHASAEREAAHLEPVRQARVELLELQLHAARDGGAELLLQPQAHRFLEGVPEAPADQLCARRAQHLLGLLVEEGVLAVAVHRGEGFAAAQRRAHAQQGAGAQAARRDLLHGALHGDDAAGSVMDGLAERTHPGAPAVGKDDLRFLVERLALGRAGLQQALQRGLATRRVVPQRVVGRWRVARRRAVQRGQLVRPDEPGLLQVETPDTDGSRALQHAHDVIVLRAGIVERRLGSRRHGRRCDVKSPLRALR